MVCLESRSCSWLERDAHDVTPRVFRQMAYYTFPTNLVNCPIVEPREEKWEVMRGHFA